MTRRLLIYSFAAALMLSVPAVAMATEWELTDNEQVEERITVTVSQNVASINGAQGETLEVVSLTGKKMMTVKIDSPAQRVELNIPKGCYILKVGNVVRKITVK